MRNGKAKTILTQILRSWENYIKYFKHLKIRFLAHIFRNLNIKEFEKQKIIFFIILKKYFKYPK